MTISRRSFLKGTGAVGIISLVPTAKSQAQITDNSYATFIDLSKCDGCKAKDTPFCVAACKNERQQSFPKVNKDQLQDYWPQKKHEDWSEKRHLTDRFTAYNWIFVQDINVDGEEISIPRRCMHCDNPPCAKLCPFGVNHKTVEGPVYIDQSLCFGGAKCRSVCPWHVPQRQAGVGIYTLWQKYLPVGGGVMFKCDLCRKILAEGKTPYCINACPQEAMKIGRRDEIFHMAKQLQDEEKGYLYGMDENGGTSTIYFSKISFDKIDKALIAKYNRKKKPKFIRLHKAENLAQVSSDKIDRPLTAKYNRKKNPKLVRLHKAENLLERNDLWAQLSLISPLIGAVAAFTLTKKTSTSDKQKEK